MTQPPPNGGYPHPGADPRQPGVNPPVGADPRAPYGYGQPWGAYPQQPQQNWSGQPAGYPVPQPPKKKKRWPWILGGVVVLFVALVVIFLLTSPTRPSRVENAVQACQDTVSDRLSAPASAEFTADPAVREDPTDTWTISGGVDSQNALGTVLRANYKCNVQFMGDSKYSVEITSMTQQ